jgi:hypothetical protein
MDRLMESFKSEPARKELYANIQTSLNNSNFPFQKKFATDFLRDANLEVQVDGEPIGTTQLCGDYIKTMLAPDITFVSRFFQNELKSQIFALMGVISQANQKKMNNLVTNFATYNRHNPFVNKQLIRHLNTGERRRRLK